MAKLHQSADEGNLASTTATSLTSTHVIVGEADLMKDSPIVAPALIDKLTEVNGAKITDKFISEAQKKKMRFSRLVLQWMKSRELKLVE